MLLAYEGSDNRNQTKAVRGPGGRALIAKNIHLPSLFHPFISALSPTRDPTSNPTVVARSIIILHITNTATIKTV